MLYLSTTMKLTFGFAMIEWLFEAPQGTRSPMFESMNSRLRVDSSMVAESGGRILGILTLTFVGKCLFGTRRGAPFLSS